MFSALFSKPSSSLRQVSPRELESLPAGTRIVDVREPHEFAEDHLPEAELVPLAQLPGVAKSWARSEPVLVLCRSGGRSSRAAAELQRLGFENVMNLTGGMLAVRTP